MKSYAAEHLLQARGTLRIFSSKRQHLVQPFLTSSTNCHIPSCSRRSSRANSPNFEVSDPLVETTDHASASISPCRPLPSSLRMSTLPTSNSLLPNEIIVRMLSELPPKDIVHARAVSKTWYNVIEEFASLQYLVWSWIHGTTALGLSPPSAGVNHNHDVGTTSADNDNVHNQLEKLLQIEQNWNKLSFARRDTIKFDEVKFLCPAGPTSSSFSNVVNGQGKLVGRYHLPLSLDDSPPEAIAFPISDKQPDEVAAFDALTDVLVIRSRVITYSIMCLSKPDIFHPRAKQPTISCSGFGSSASCNVRIFGSRLVSFTPDTDGKRILHIWDWTTGELLRCQVINMSEDYEGKGISDEPHISLPVLLDDDHFAILRSANGEPRMWLEIFSISGPAIPWEEYNGLLTVSPNSVLLFPTLRDDIWVEDVELVCRPISSDLSEDRLFQIIVTALPTENDLIRCYSFFAYINPVLRAASSSSTVVQWKHWGVENTACFEWEMGLVDRMSDSWYSFGDRVAILDSKGRTEGPERLYNWGLRVLDFRPERIRRTGKTVRGKKYLWPAEHKVDGEEQGKPSRARTVHKDELCKSQHMFPFKKPVFKCLLPFIETQMEGHFEATVATVEMDARRVFIKKDTVEFPKTETEVLTT